MVGGAKDCNISLSTLLPLLTDQLNLYFMAWTSISLYLSQVYLLPDCKNTKVSPSSMDLPASTVFFVILSFCLCNAKPRQILSVLTVTNGAPWGDWGEPEICPRGHADGFAVKISKYQGPLAWDDDTGMDGIRLHCTDGSTVESSSAQWGDWSDFVMCPKDTKLSLFSLRVEEFQGVKDDTAANNIQFKCADDVVLEGGGHPWGTFGHWSNKCFLSHICGLQTRVQPPQGPGDDTGLTDVKFFCCSVMDIK
ncbi:hypothetical protein lerEdw1_006570 [Lerista edwardsae]|nr:hypothetical protein lerEdw1_006570 [Lerista edwardsae]